MATTTISGRIQSGFVLVPEDRQRDSLVPTLSVMDNMLLASLKKYLRGFILAPTKEKSAIDSSMLFPLFDGSNLEVRILLFGILYS